MSKTTRRYLAFSKWRVQLYRSQKPRHSVRFFRRSRNHSLLWNFIMHGHYAGSPPSVGACEGITAWSRPTTRKLLHEAQACTVIMAMLALVVAVDAASAWIRRAKMQ